MIRLARCAAALVMLVMLLSCGGGGGGGGGGTFVGPVGAASEAAPTPFGSANQASLFGAGSGANGTSGANGANGANGSGDGYAAAGGGGGNAGSGSASSSGGAGAGTGNSTAASGGSGDDSGVGSGGTGVSTADAVGIGAVDGFGSVIVNGVRYADDAAVRRIADTDELKLGMTARVIGPVDAAFANGVARTIVSEADLRGPVSNVDLQQGSFMVLGINVTTDESTVYGDGPGLGAIVPGSTVQVWGLPGAAGVLRATRIERNVAAPGLIVSGSVEQLDSRSLQFRLGSLLINLNPAAGTVAGLANSTIVRVRALTLPFVGQLAASSVESWYGAPAGDGTPVQLAGLITDFGGLGAFRVIGVPIDASAAQITGGPLSGIGNGVRVEAAGVLSGGVLKVSKLRLRHVPGTGGPVSFAVSGKIKDLGSAANFRIKSQRIDASGAGVVFVNGSAALLREDANVSVTGDRVVEGTLIASRVSFLN
ncbi:Erythrocyte membrane protein 1 (PfEMP1) [Burkholderiales bacterium 8X]|nr:Erythrocyte membrane protein 1 (PfEMP1) [Burkholderiales bacterium 8X]